jgi:hypothetical protein
MRLRLLSFPVIISTLAAALTMAPTHDAGFTVGSVNAQSMSKLTFAPDGTLFIGDSIGARIFAVDLDDRTPVNDPSKLNVSDLERKIGGMLGVDARDVLIHDMAVTAKVELEDLRLGYFRLHRQRTAQPKLACLAGSPQFCGIRGFLG